MGFSDPTKAKSDFVFVCLCKFADFFHIKAWDDSVFCGFFGVEWVALFVGDVEFHLVLFALQKRIDHGDFSCAVRNDQYANFLHLRYTVIARELRMLNLPC